RSFGSKARRLKEDHDAENEWRQTHGRSFFWFSRHRFGSQFRGMTNVSIKLRNATTLHRGRRCIGNEPARSDAFMALARCASPRSPCSPLRHFPDSVPAGL